MAATGAAQRAMLAWVCTVIFGQHHAGNIHFAAANVGVHVNRASHDHFAA